MPDTSLLSPTGPLGALLTRLFEMGGPVMMVLVAMAFAGAITFIYLMLVGALYAPRLTGTLKKIMTVWQQTPEQARPGALRQRAGPHGRLNPLLHLVADTIEACQQRQPPDRVRAGAVQTARNALVPFEAPLKIIEVIAALAPLLGLLGTVMGMMEAFGAMAATEGRANATQLSGGIYQALTTTAAGLVIAIPFAALAAWIEFRLRRLHSTVNTTLAALLSGAPEPEAPAGVLITTDLEAAAPPSQRPAARSEPGHAPRHATAHATG